ncbi:MAG: serine/threonine-protein kinase [Opitutaceae bacterium]
MRCATCESPLPSVTAGDLCPRCALTHALSLGETAATAPPSAAKDHRPVIAGYEPHYELGRGGMGVVWLARDTRLDRLVALKVIAAGADPRLGPRLLREGRAIAQLRHPHIVSVYALEQTEAATFLAMDFFEGGDLQARLHAQPLAPRAAGALVRKLADALAHAHASGVIHRDLKPSNILLDAADEPHLADFGLAAALEGAGDLTAPGTVAGTPGFLAPELLAGADRASPLSDVYGLGAVLYACVTGRAPFVGDSAAAILAQLVDREPPSPRLLNPAVPRDLETLCLKCLEKNPVRRYASAADLRDDLDRFARGEPLAARPVGRGGKILRWSRRKPALAAVSAAACALVVILAIGGPLTAWRIERARAAAENSRREALAAEARTREQLRAALLARSHATRLTGQIGQRAAALQAAEEAAHIRPGLDARDAVIAALVLPDVTLLREWPLRTSLRHQVNFAPDHDRYVVMNDGGDLELRRLSDAGLIRAFDGTGAALQVGPHFSPDGRRVVARDAEGRVAVWREDRAAPLFLLEGRRYLLGGGVGGYGAPDAFSPDGRVLASAVAGGGVSFHSTADGRELSRLATDAEPSHVAYSPDGHLLAVGRGLRVRAGSPAVFARVFETEKGTEISRLPVNSAFQSLAWSRDSASLLLVGQQLEVFDARSGRRTRAVIDPRATRGIFGPGDTIIGASQSGLFTLWDPATARPMLGGALGGQPEIEINRAGTTIVKTATEQGRIYRLELSPVVRTVASKALEGYDNVTNHGGAALDYSQDGRWLATAVWGAVQLREAATGEVLTRAALGSANNHCSVRFAADGASLLVASRELGLVRLPIRCESDSAPRLGPPETLDAETDFMLADLSRDGRRAVLVSMWRSEVKVVNLAGDQSPVRWNLPGAGRAVFLADGREVLANSTAEMGRAPLTIYDAETGRELRVLRQTRGYHVRTSSDGRWIALGTGANDSSLLRTADWTPGSTLPLELQGAGKNAALSPGGEWLAIATGNQVGLLRTSDGTVVAHLENTRSGTYVPELGFSPDGSRLTLCWENGLLTIWDLKALRAELAARGLDW